MINFTFCASSLMLISGLYIGVGERSWSEFAWGLILVGASGYGFGN